ncbi:MAG: VTT domain-containing protein [Methanobrevibacter sp.]|uniref:DedA family protein n=1 Tax=Methanobrevibacter sp. TaxID=66852 RepID=UPI0026E0A602|nr:VTT domain-containing protein [Methanobrevibacter sp.]MDO5849436.1 VTT domain-containing protein [Methanobrevibacter sp.]
MLEYLIELVNMFFLHYGAIGVFVATLIGSIIAPVPSTLIVVTGGFFMLKADPINLHSLGKLLFNISIPVGLGITIGSTIIYSLCYYIGKPFVDRYGRYIGLNWDEIEKFESGVSNLKRDYLYIYLTRVIPVIPNMVISVFCGIMRYNPRKFLITTFLGGVTRALILGFIGWEFGTLSKDISGHMTTVEHLLIVLIIMAIAGYLVYRRRNESANELKANNTNNN